jgi:hypothetical protein
MARISIEEISEGMSVVVSGDVSTFIVGGFMVWISVKARVVTMAGADTEVRSRLSAKPDLPSQPGSDVLPVPVLHQWEDP